MTIFPLDQSNSMDESIFSFPPSAKLFHKNIAQQILLSTTPYRATVSAYAKPQREGVARQREEQQQPPDKVVEATLCTLKVILHLIEVIQGDRGTAKVRWWILWWA